jgi:hypothetical protein
MESHGMNHLSLPADVGAQAADLELRRHLDVSAHERLLPTRDFRLGSMIAAPLITCFRVLALVWRSVRWPSH